MQFLLKKIAITSIFFFLVTRALYGADIAARQITLPLPEDVTSFKKIRILVMRDKPEIQISCTAPFEAFDDQGKSVVRDTQLSGATIKPVTRGIQWWAKVVPTKFILVQSKMGSIRLGRVGIFRDTILIYKNSNGKIDVVNQVELDDYLKGVLPFEANPQWAYESLKAQAVVSRTFAFFKMLERQKEIYDVSSGMYSQVYAGKHIENEKTNQAIEDTQGQILIYDSKIFLAFYHSTCGGATTAAELVWRVKPLVPLGGVECRFCSNSPHYRWQATVTRQEIQSKLARHGMPLHDVQSLQLEKIDKTGRAHMIQIKSKWWQKNLDADAFRGWIDPAKLKSNLITKITTNDAGDYVFKGRGWGHGVGLCQYGMKYLGELGYSYREILSYYYPGSQVLSVKGWGE